MDFSSYKQFETLPIQPPLFFKATLRVNNSFAILENPCRPLRFHDWVEIRTATPQPTLCRVVELREAYSYNHKRHVLTVALLIVTDSRALSRTIGKNPILYRVLGELHFACDLSLMGRVLDGLGSPRDEGPPLVATERWKIYNRINLLSKKHALRPTILETGVSSIDIFSPVTLGSSIAVVSSFGLPHDQLLIDMCRHLRPSLADQMQFSFVVAGLGLSQERYTTFIDQFKASGLFDRTVFFMNKSNESWEEALLTPHLATAAAEYLAHKHGHHVVVLLSDMDRFNSAIRHTFLDRHSTNAVLPHLLAPEYSALYDRARLFARGSVTIISAITIASGKPVEWNPGSVSACRLADTSIVLDHTRYSHADPANSIYPPVHPLQSNSRLSHRLLSHTEAELLQSLASNYYNGCIAKQTEAVVGALDEDEAQYVAFLNKVDRWLDQPFLSFEARTRSESIAMSCKILIEAIARGGSGNLLEESFYLKEPLYSTGANRSASSSDIRSKGKLNQQSVFIKRSIFNAIEKPPNEDTITKDAFIAYLKKEGYEATESDVDELWACFKPGPDGKVDHIQFFVSTNFDPFIQKLQTIQKAQQPRTPSKAQSRQVLAEMRKVGELQSTFESIAEEDRRRRRTTMNLFSTTSPKLSTHSPKADNTLETVTYVPEADLLSPTTRSVSAAPTIRAHDESSTSAEGPTNDSAASSAAAATTTTATAMTHNDGNYDPEEFQLQINSRVGQLSSQVHAVTTEILDMDDRVSLLEKAASTPVKSLRPEMDTKVLQGQVESLSATVDSKIEESTQLTAQIIRNVLSKLSDLEAKVDARLGSPVDNRNPAEIGNESETRLSAQFDDKLKQLESKIDAALGRVAVETNKHADTQIVSVSESFEDSIEKASTKSSLAIKQVEESLTLKLDASIVSLQKQLASSTSNSSSTLPEDKLTSLVQRIESLERQSEAAPASAASPLSQAEIERRLATLEAGFKLNEGKESTDSIHDRLQKLEKLSASISSQLAQDKETLERISAGLNKITPLNSSGKTDEPSKGPQTDVVPIVAKAGVAALIGAAFASLTFGYGSSSNNSSANSSSSVAKGAAAGLMLALVVLSSNLLDAFVFSKRK